VSKNRKDKLTPKQERFCIEYLKTGNASEAYRQSYSAGKMKPASVNRLAKALLDNIKIASRIKALRKPVIKKAQITLESHLEDLMRLRNLAVNKNQIAAAITAEIARGKAAGIHIEKSQVDLNLLNPMVIIRNGS
jgi:phage terminase small subunit